MNEDEEQEASEFPSIKHIDFSIFHDMMHMPFSPYCWTMYGGPLHHIKLWWEFRAWEAIRRQTFCRVGKHRVGNWHQRKPVERHFKACIDCAKEVVNDG